MKRYTILLFLLCLVGACSDKTHPASVHDRDDPYLDKGRVQWNSSNLPHHLKIEKMSVDRTDAGLLHVRMIIRNRTKNDIFVDIQTLFTDVDGFEKEKTNWEPFCCTARTQNTYSITSLGANVHDYRVIIRDPREFRGTLP